MTGDRVATREAHRRAGPSIRFGAAAALLCALTAPPSCWSAEPVAPASEIAAPEPIVLKVTLNGEEKGDVFVARTADSDFLVKLEDLRRFGLKDPVGNVVVFGGDRHLSLRSIQGISFAFDEPNLALNITAAPALLPSHSVGLLEQRRLQATTTRTSGFVNYAFEFARSGSAASSTDFSGEAGWRAGDYLFLSNVSTAQQSDGSRKLVRMMTSLTRDDMENLRRTVLGDFFTPVRELSNGLNLGGLSVSKLYSLDPYLVQFPLQTVSGTVALPSDLEVYLDGQRIRSEKLKPGEFELRDILAYNGARTVRLVLRDAFGRTQELDYSFYFSDQPLRRGLHEYSYNLGFIRRSYGLSSNRYGPPALAAFHRYGVTDAVTLGFRAEARRNFFNAGPIATMVLGRLGVVNLAVAASSLESRRGTAASATYNYQAGTWSLSLAARRDSREYATIGDPPLISNRRYEASAVTSYSFPTLGVISFSHTARSVRNVWPSSLQVLSSLPSEARKVSSLSYSAPLIGNRASLTATVSRVKDSQVYTEFGLRIVVFFDKDYSAAASHQAGGPQRRDNLQLTKNQPIGEGLGYVVQAERTTEGTLHMTHGWSTLQYNAPFAMVRGEYGRREGSGSPIDEYRMSVAGGVGYADGTIAAGRPITGSFGIVKVGELADVAVSVNGQPMGRTARGGKLLLPTLGSYYDNQIWIAPETVPIEYSLAATEKKVAPSLRGGAVIDFGVAKIQAFTGKLLSARAPQTAIEFQEFTVLVRGTPQRLQTGRGGEFYIENIPPGTYTGTARIDDVPCSFDLIIPKSDETFVQLGATMCRATR